MCVCVCVLFLSRQPHFVGARDISCRLRPPTGIRCLPANAPRPLLAVPFRDSDAHKRVRRFVATQAPTDTGALLGAA